MHTLSRLAQIIGAELIGDPEAMVQRAEAFDRAGECDVTYAQDPAYRARINQSLATAVIVSPPVEEWSKNILLSANPKLAFARAIQALHGIAYSSTGVSKDAVFGKDVVIGDDASVHPRVTVGKDAVIGRRVTLHSGVVIGERCRIGDDVIIYPNVSVYADCEIGNRVIIHAGAVIGADGFGFVKDELGRQVKILQLGRVIIEDDCEIGANCAIDRGAFNDTVIRRGVKLDNFIQVGHGCEIGEDTVVAALAGFSGGTVVGRGCVIGGQAGTTEHVRIGDRSIVTARSVVTKNIRPGSLVGGMMPAQDYNVWRRSQALYYRLPEIAQRLKRLEDEIGRRGGPRLPPGDQGMDSGDGPG